MKLNRAVVFRTLGAFIMSGFLVTSAFSQNTQAISTDGAATPPGVMRDSNFDRLDGTGESGAKVTVVEWEGNLEVHAAPKGILKGVGMTIDHKKQGDPVMVFAYRFADKPDTQIIRRNVFNVPLKDNFKVYVDPSENDYDKIIITMNTMSSGVVAYHTDAAPTQLYPDGHPALVASDTSAPSDRNPANDNTTHPNDTNNDTGTVHPFFFDKH